MNINISQKFILFWLLLIGLLASFSINIVFENQLADELSITSAVLTGIALFFTGVFLVLDTILDICNP